MPVLQRDNLERREFPNFLGKHETSSSRIGGAQAGGRSDSLICVHLWPKLKSHALNCYAEGVFIGYA